jgi:Predicted permease
MEWLHNLVFNDSVAHSLLILSVTIAGGVFLGDKLKIKGVSLGVTWILFCGIALSHFGMRLNVQVEQFAKDLGLILFVYSIGLHVGPSFFSSLRKGGLSLNLLAVGIVLTGAVLAVALHFITGIDMPTMVGIMSGAVTNTPGLGAAQQAFAEITGNGNPEIAAGYAVAYPLGVVGIIVSILLLKQIFHVKLTNEEQRLKSNPAAEKEPVKIDLEILNPQVIETSVADLKKMCKVDFVISRIIHPDGQEKVANADSMLNKGDVIRILLDEHELKAVELIGKPKPSSVSETRSKNSKLVSRRLAVTRPECNGKRLRELHLRDRYNVTITRVNRAGFDLLAVGDLYLQMGDRVMVVGEEKDVEKVSEIFGNSMKRLDVPNLIPIFLGIALGVLLGSIPIPLPGLSQSFKLGLAGGPLIVAILISRWGPYYRMVTFTTTSANRMIREIGISLFLAAVGLGVGDTFVSTIVNGGYVWIGYGVIITMVPLLLIGFIARKWLKLDFFSVMGLMAGSTTDPPALAYASSVSVNNDQASVSYATVYPLTMFLRVMVAQILIMAFV